MFVCVCVLVCVSVRICVYDTDLYMCVCAFVCATCYVWRVFGCVSVCVYQCVCISVCVYVRMPVTLWEQERIKHAQVKQGKAHVNRSRTRQTKDLGSDHHPENDTTTVANIAGCTRQCIGAPFNTLAIVMLLQSTSQGKQA